MERLNGCRLLSLVWYKVLPAQMGGQKGIAFFNEALAQYVHLECLCARTNIAAEKLHYTVLPELPKTKFQFINPFVFKKIFNVIRRVKPTHLLIEHPYYGLAGILARRKFGIPFIIHEHNIEWLRFKTMKRPGWRLLKWFEGLVLRRANLVLFKSETDRQLALTHHHLHPDKTGIVPYGTWLKEPPPEEEKRKNREWLCRTYQIPENHTLLLFNGTFDYLPNKQALNHITQYILPLLQEKGVRFTLVLCGKNLLPGFSEQNRQYAIVYAGLVPDTRPYYTGCDVFINPVLTGGGVKTKLVEAIAHNLTTISTQTGAAGIPVTQCGEKLVVCADNDWEAFVNAIIRAKKNLAYTPPVFCQTFNWQRIAQETAVKINRLVGK